MIVIKVGGNDLEKPEFIPELGRAVADLQHQQPVILVHGGGRSINDLLDRLGISPAYVNGQRITDQAVLEVVEMVLSGRINKQLVLALLDAGIDSIGLSGVDRGLLRVEQWSEELGQVGRVIAVRTEVLHELCQSGVVPVVSPISAGAGGRYNVNADHAAGAIAGAMDATCAIFVTNVPGVADGNATIPHITASEAHHLIQQGIIHGGMIPKVSAALDALAQGARQAIITDLPGLQRGTGTTIVA